MRRGTCVVALDVASDDERDEVQPWAACVAALGLADRCLGGGYRLGGRSTVGARGVVGLVVCGREGRDGEGLGLEMADVATVDGGGIDGSVLGTGNTTSLELRTRSRVNVPGLDARGMCVEMPGDHAIGAAVDYGDCYRAAEEIIEGKPRDIPLRFSRKPNAEYRLPATFDYGTCSIIVDVLDANDEDTFGVSTLYGAALDVANRCTMSPGQAVDIWGGNRTAGLKGLVNVFVSGMGSLDVVSGPTTSGNAQIVPRTQAESKVPESSDSSSLNSDVPILEALAGGRKPGLNTSAIISKRSSAGIGTSLRGPLTCYDPPLPRELLYPYVASDCDEASDQIVGNRNKWAAYIFSRKPSISPYWYQLPVKYKYGSCVILIDMNDDKAEDAVRVTYVASSAWVLARKCSGEENPEYRYGGFMTVSVGAADLISIHVYGRPSTRQSPTLTLSQNASSINRG